MRLLPSEQEKRVKEAIKQFEDEKTLNIYEPCNCGSRISHNNGGNYHEEIYLCRDGSQVFVKYDTTCELVAPAEWQECKDPKSIIRQYADWL